MIAEIELTNAAEEVALPSWVKREVSDDPRYFNNNLAVYPYKEWRRARSG